MKLAASIARSLEADLQAELRDVERRWRSRRATEVSRSSKALARGRRFATQAGWWRDLRA